MTITPGAAEHSLNIIIEHAMSENGILTGGSTTHRLYVGIYEAAYLVATHRLVAEVTRSFDDYVSHVQAAATAERILRAMVRSREDEIIAAAITMVKAQAAPTA